MEPRYNEVLGTMKITLLFQVSHYIRIKKQRNIKNWDQQNYLVIRGFCYIRRGSTVFACNTIICSSARNTILGVEIVHFKCGLKIVSNDRGNDSMLRLEHPRWMEMCTI